MKQILFPILIAVMLIGCNRYKDNYNKLNKYPVQPVAPVSTKKNNTDYPSKFNHAIGIYIFDSVNIIKEEYCYKPRYLPKEDTHFDLLLSNGELIFEHNYRPDSDSIPEMKREEVKFSESNRSLFCRILADRADLSREILFYLINDASTIQMHFDQTQANYDSFVAQLNGDENAIIRPDEILIFDAIFKKAMGKINNTGVRVRATPELTGDTLSYLSNGEIMVILGISKEKQQIGELEAYWYEVKINNENNIGDGILTGWVFGAYIDIEDKEKFEKMLEGIIRKKTRKWGIPLP